MTHVGTYSRIKSPLICEGMSGHQVSRIMRTERHETESRVDILKHTRVMRLYVFATQTKGGFIFMPWIIDDRTIRQQDTARKTKQVSVTYIQ